MKFKSNINHQRLNIATYGQAYPAKWSVKDLNPKSLNVKSASITTWLRCFL